MFLSDVNKKEEIRTIALRQLRSYGIKFRFKTPRQHVQVAKSRKLFNTPLQSLENETVTLMDGQQLVVPKRLHEMCLFILSQAGVEGIFRKEGSKSRQNEIKLSLDRGCMLGTEHHVIDVAVVLKSFFRQLPEPLIPYYYHELFLRCSLIEDKLQAILLSCLLLPTEHLNVLAYLMNFLYEITTYSKSNKMNSSNLAIVLSPNVFLINEKVVPKNKLMLKKTCDIVKLLIENAKNVGHIPEYIIEQIASPKNKSPVPNRTKRRRSGSLTRIFNGLKRIVGNKTEDDTPLVPPDLITTTGIQLVAKQKGNDALVVASKSTKRTMIERRWSAITSSSNLKRKKKDQLVYQPNEDSLEGSRSDYMRVRKTEYEEIKSRVSAIEKRLSLEFDNVHSGAHLHDIQSAYRQTLEQVEQLSPRTDVIARRLSRELRIRNSADKMIRSPSARKIGNIRRRSMEKMTKIGSLQRSVSSPIRSEIVFNGEVLNTPISIDSNTIISLNNYGNTFEFSGNLEYETSPREERKALKRTSSENYTCLSGRCSHKFTESDKENGKSSTPKVVPLIKKAMPVSRTPKKMCLTPHKVIRINTPLRVLREGNNVISLQGA